MIDAPDLSLEQAFWTHGLTHIAGMDEAGRGALAGPVAVGVVILPTSVGFAGTLSGVRDSKQMTPHQRDYWIIKIKTTALAWATGSASAAEIDSLGIAVATRLAALRSLESLPVPFDYLLTDFRLELPETGIPQTSLVKGDQWSLSVAAASVLAKTCRDAWMVELDKRYPGYGLAKHKGYGTQAHRDAIIHLGFTPSHRKSFSVKA